MERSWRRTVIPEKEEKKLNSMVELVSIHIPKTAGSSFFQVLKKVYGKEAVFKINTMGDGLKDEIPVGISVIHGHIRIEELTRILEKYRPKLITWFREPVDRVISNYYFSMQRIREGKARPEKIHTRNYTLLQYAGMEENRNRANWFIGGQSLEEFFFIGMYESIEEDMSSLMQMMNWPEEISIPHRKSSSDFIDNNDCATKFDEIDDKMRAQIAELNSLDVVLYQRAVKLREKKQK